MYSAFVHAEEQQIPTSTYVPATVKASMCRCCVGSVEKSWDMVGEQGGRGGYTPNCLWDCRGCLKLFLVIWVSNSLMLWPALPAVVLIFCFSSNARRHALCIATKTLTLLLLIMEKLWVTGPDCTASDVCGALMPRAEFGQ